MDSTTAMRTPYASTWLEATAARVSRATLAMGQSAKLCVTDCARMGEPASHQTTAFASKDLLERDARQTLMSVQMALSSVIVNPLVSTCPAGTTVSAAMATMTTACFPQVGSHV